MKWIFSKAVICVVLLFCAVPSFAANTQVIFGIHAAQNFKSKSAGKFYIQAGSFLDKSKAAHYKKSLQSKTTYPIKISKQGNYNIVVIGPMSSAAAVREVAANISPKAKITKTKKSKIKAAQVKSKKPKVKASSVAKHQHKSTPKKHPKQITKHTDQQQIIYGLAKARHFKGKSTGKTYIQADSFLSKDRATSYQKQLQSETTYPVTIFNSVMVGPVASASEVRRVAGSLQPPTMAEAEAPAPEPVAELAPFPAPENQPTYTPKDNIMKQPVVYKDQAPLPKKPRTVIPVFANAKWFVSMGAGEQYPHFNSSTSINNGSGFPPPFDEDIYSTNMDSQPVVALAGGLRWERPSPWFPTFSAGLFYQYFSTTNAGGKITQYSTPSFTNYRYNWSVSSDVLMAFAKLNLVKYSRLSPYVNVGLGSAFNRSSNYEEKPEPNVTPRQSAAFASQTRSQFAYNAGVGVDYQVNKQFILSAGYEYFNLGKVSSGTGAGLWRGQSLHLGNYQSNEALISVSYLFDN